MLNYTDRNMNSNSNSQGTSKWFSILLIALVVIVAVQFAKPYYRYYMLLIHTKSTIKIQSTNTKIIREKIISYADMKNIPLREENLSVNIEHMTVTVSAEWSDMIDLYGYYQKRVDFVIDEEF